MSRQVDLWAFRLGEVPEGLVEKCLSPQEMHAAHTFLMPEDRARARTGRAALRLILGQRLGCDPEALLFHQPAGHRPLLAGVPHAPGFSVSHSGILILIALADGPVGVDVELRREGDWIGLAERFFEAGEMSWLQSLPHDVQADGFFRLWTMKEAYLKGLGIGLTRALDGFSVPPAGGQVDDPEEEVPWHVMPLELVPGYSAAIAANGGAFVPVWQDAAQLTEWAKPVQMM